MQTISMGQRFEVAGTTYMLCQVGYCQVALINLDNGNRLEDPIPVANAMALTADEVKRVFYSMPQYWYPEEDPNEEPVIDDTVHVCPDCERPNQFGELCEDCRQERQAEIDENRD